MLRAPLVLFVVALSSVSTVLAQPGNATGADALPADPAPEGQGGGNAPTSPASPGDGEGPATLSAPVAPGPSPAPAAIPVPPAPSATPAPSPRELFEWAAQARTEEGYTCAPQTALIHAGLGYVACGAGGVWVCGFDPQQGWALREVIAVRGMVVGLQVQGGQVAAGVVHPVPVPLDSLRQSPAAGAQAACDMLEKPGVAVDGLVVTLQPHGRHCLHRRQHVLLLDKDENVLAVARVARVRRDVRLTLGYHEQVKPEEVASVWATSASLTSSRVAPQRAESMWLARAHARPFISPAPAGGVLGEVAVEYVFRRRAFLRAEASPLAVAAGETSDFDFAGSRSATIGAAFAGVVGGVDTRFFAFGAGLAVVTVNAPQMDQAPGSGTAFPIFVRFGARDGLSLELRGDTTLFLSSLHFTGVFGKLNVPLTHSVAIQLNAGGGPMGVESGYVALRKLARGNGGPGSLFWETSIGGGSVFRDVCERPSNASEGFEGCFTRGKDALNGFTLGFGLERRF